MPQDSDGNSETASDQGRNRITRAARVSAGALDRHDKDAITLLFAAFPNKRSIKVRKQQKEICNLNDLSAYFLGSAIALLLTSPELMG
jgi:hypothetical protein